MHLLDIPPELFQQIAHDLVEVAGITGAWKLRETCRSFAAEISYDVFVKRPVTEFARWPENQFLDRTIDRYLAARLRLPLDADKGFLGKIQSIVNWVLLETDSKTVRSKDDTTERICAGLLKRQGGSMLVYAITPNPRSYHGASITWSQQGLTIHDKVFAALSVGDYDLVEGLLPELIDGPKGIVWLAIAPFQIAIRRRDLPLFHATLRALKKLAARDPTRMTSVQNTQADGEYVVNVHHAISYAVQYKRLEILQALLDFSEKFLPRPSNHTYDRWISMSARSGADMLDALSKFNPKGRSMVTRQTLNTLCYAGTGNMIRAVGGKLGSSINSGSIITLPLFVAVRSGRPVAVEALVDAGANVGIVARSNIRSLTKANLTPLEVAIYHQKLEVVDVLIKRGAGPIPHVTEWPQGQRTFNHLRRIVQQTTGTDLPTWKQFRHLSAEERKSIAH